MAASNNVNSILVPTRVRHDHPKSEPIGISVVGDWENGGLIQIDVGKGPVELCVRGEPWKLLALLALERRTPTVSVCGFLPSRCIDTRLNGDPYHPRQVNGKSTVHDITKIAFRLRNQLAVLAGGGAQGRAYVARHIFEHSKLGYRLKPTPLKVQVAVGDRRLATHDVNLLRLPESRGADLNPDRRF